jgi:putative membrane-bound dehydrogenase-like protein
MTFDDRNHNEPVRWPLRQRPAWIMLAAGTFALIIAQRAPADDEALIFTPDGFTQPGEARVAIGENTGRLRITVRDRATSKPTPCRLNVIGPDGRFYQPEANELSPYSLTGQWPKIGKGNRAGKAPIRYLGRFFYTRGQTEVAIPGGTVRIEAWKGFEFRPVAMRIEVAAGQTHEVSIELTRTASAAELGYHSGDPHLHFPRKTETDDRVIFDLLQAEDIHFGSILAYNEPAGPYTGTMEAMDAPQLRGLGQASIAHRDDTWIVSGQEYRSSTYGHLNLLWRDDLVLKGQKVDANNWPLYGELGRQTRQRGGFSVYAHGGYAQAIYADFVQKSVDAVELLQFGVYRGIELDDWYHILNIGYRFPCVGASDYPACRKLGDCQTYAYLDDKSDFAAWLKAAASGRSFVTSGPLLLLEVGSERPGGIIRKPGVGPQRVQIRVRATCEVAPIEAVQLIINGKVTHELAVPENQRRSRWIELNRWIELDRPSWIAARAFSKTLSGAPDAEAHTNPVYVYLDDKAPYDRDSLDRLVGRIDEQVAAHRKRRFEEKARVLDYFQRSRDILLSIRRAGGLTADGVPENWIEGDASATIDASRRTHSDGQLARFLQPVPALTSDEALKTFETVDGFRMELVAAEPMVQSPVAAAFDADGNLYVAEMRDYPYKPKPGNKPLGTVRVLRDTDRDGRFDHSTVFADGLLWAAGITPWRGGVFVTAPPDIWYLKDTNGDFRADVRQKVYTGFGTQNQQAMANNLTWGLDHFIYGASGGNGGTIRPAEQSQAPGVSVDHSDFRFDPETAVFEPITGAKQFGNTFDDWGNRFMCSQDSPLFHAVLPRHKLARNAYLAVPDAVYNIAGSAVPIFRISPVEHWRQIRSSRRVAHSERPAGSSGVSHHVVDAGAGVTIYRGSAYPPEFYGNAFIGDAQNNLVHRQVLIPDGPTFQVVRAPREQTTEFVRSSDNWFRPVNFVNAPDGTLFVLDMSRAVIEAIHIPLDVVKHLDLRRGRDQGRIYRIAPPGFRYVPTPQLSRVSTPELVAALRRRDAWYRDTAHRLIHERQDPAAIGPLRRLLTPAVTAVENRIDTHAPKTEGCLPQTRVSALWSLEGLKALRDEDLTLPLADSEAEVRAQAVQLAARRLNRSLALREQVLNLARDPDSRVRFHVAFALGEMTDPRAITVLAQIARADVANRWIRAAVLSSSGSTASRLLAEVWNDLSRPTTTADSASRGELLRQLAEIVGARNRPDEVSDVLDNMAAIGRTTRPAREAGTEELGLKDNLVLALAHGARRSGHRLAASTDPARPGTSLVADWLRRSRTTALDDRVPDPARVQAIVALSAIDPDTSCALLASLIEPRQPLSVQVAAVRALGETRGADVAALLLGRLRRFEPPVRAVAVRTLLGRSGWTKALLQAASGHGPSGISPNLIDPADRAPLLKHRDPELVRLAQTAFGQTATQSRVQVIADYSTTLRTRGEAGRGAKVFERECKGCHKVGDRGFALGPDLTGSPSADPAALLANILDPNANVPPNYVQYLLQDQAGRSFSGIIAAETATSLTLRRSDGAEDIILRAGISEMTSTGLSLMPEGLEKTISKPEMADLIAFLQGAHRGGDQEGGAELRSRPLDIGTLPGLIEPDD